MKNRIYWLITALSVAFTLNAQPHKLAKDLNGLDRDASVQVIVQFKSTPTADHHLRMAKKGATLRHELPLVKAALYSVPASALEDLSNDPDVTYVSPDRPVQGLLDYAEPAIGGLTAFNAGIDGTGIGVAVIDSGISYHDDLGNSQGKQRVVYSQDFTGSGSTNDAYGHGEHVAGIIGGNATDSTGSHYTHTFRGIAPNANLITLRVLNSTGSSTDSLVIAAIDQAITLKQKYNIRIINLSLGRPVYESFVIDPLCQAVEAAWRAGIVVVVAAGNMGRDNTFGEQGYGTITAPGNDPLVITVGAMKDMSTITRSDDLIASYSSKGPTTIDHIVKPDLVAPGNLIVSLDAPGSTLATTYPANVLKKKDYETNNGNATTNTYITLSGTSMATPMVSGSAALLLQKDPSLTPDTVKARLMKTATKNFPPFSMAKPTP